MNEDRTLIVGTAGGTVTWAGNPLDPVPSLALRNHSPTGFAWGYGGSGPAQLALALLLHITDKEMALEHYQSFKWEVAEGLDLNFRLRIADVAAWLAARTEARNQA